MTDALRAIGYVRVSTDEQADHGYSIDEQERLIREVADAKGWRLVEVLRDAGWSGAREDRPGLQRLLATLDEIDVIMVWSMDRLTRDVEMFAKITKALVAAHVKVESLTAHVDLETPEGEAMAGMGAVFGQFERKRIAERVKVGMKARARSGQLNGGPRPFGYQWEDYRRDDGQIRKRAVIHEPEAALVRRIFREYVAGKSQRQIVRDLNRDGLRTQRGSQWVQGTVAKILASPLYSGGVRHKTDTYPGQHDPIIDPATWQKAAQLRDATARTKGKGRGRKPTAGHLLQGGLLRCGYCGSAMGATTKPTKTPGRLYEVYECSGRTQHGTDHCPQKPVKRAPIDSAVWEFFATVALDLDATRTAIAQGHDAKGAELAALREQAEGEAHQATERLARVRRDYTDGRLDAEDWRSFRDDLTGELEAARAQVDRLDQQQQALASEVEQIDVETAVLDELTALRAMVAGEVQGGRREGVDSFRAELRRLFTHFDLVTPFKSWPTPAEGTIGWPHHALTLDQAAATLVLYPHVRAEAITDLWDAQARFPALTRAALAVDAITPSP